MRNALLMIALMLGLGLAHAETPIAAVASTDADHADNAAIQTKAALRTERHCIRHTGTRMKVRDRDGCIANAPGRSYGRDDIERTGETDIGRALQRLDPSISRGH